MRQIDTTKITTTAGYPSLAHNPHVQVGLDFLQNALLELNQVVGNAMAPGSVISGSNVLILWGCSLVGSVMNPGSAYYNGEIFYVPGGTVSGPYPHNYVGAGIMVSPTDTGANQTVMNDGSQVSMHNLRTIAFSIQFKLQYGSCRKYTGSS